MKLLSLDIETTGLNFDKHNIIQVGMVYLDTNNHLNDKGTQFLVKHLELNGSLFALNMNLDLITKLNKIINEEGRGEYLHEESRISRVVNKFYLDNGGTERFTIVGKNAGVFDIPFINNKSNVDLYCHRRVLDVGSLYTDSNDTVIPDLSNCFRKLGISHTTEHDALTDSIDVAYLVHRKFNPNFTLSLEQYRGLIKHTYFSDY